MIVTCEQCTTQFKLDDAKIPSGGARVRCSRCQHAFFIEAPHEDDHARIDDLAQEALSRDAGPEPVPPVDEGEADWKFNEDALPAEEPEAVPSPARPATPDLAAAREAVDDLLGADAPPTSDPSPFEEAIGDLAVEDLGGSDLDSGDLDLDLDPPGDVSETSESDLALGGLDASGRDSDPLGIEAQIESEATLASPPEAPVGVAAAASAASASPIGNDIDDDLGSPRNWDFFMEGGEGDSGEGEKTPVARVELVPRWKLLELEQEKERREACLDADDPASDLDARRGKASTVARAIGHGLGWIATLGLIAAGTWSTLGPHRVDRSAVAPTQVLGYVEAEIVASRWIDNAVVGPVYVVSGQLRGTRNGDPVAVGGLSIELLDASGVRLDLPPTPIASPLHPIHLREHPPASLALDLEAGARALASNQLRAGDAIPFQAYFADLPPEAARFHLVPTELPPEPPPATLPQTEFVPDPSA